MNTKRILTRIYLTGLAAMIGVRSYYVVKHQQKRETNGDKTEKSLLMLQLLGMQILPLIYVFSGKLNFADFRLPKKANIAAGLTGAMAFGGAVWLLHRSHADLGDNWTTELQDQENQILVTSGIYRSIRHPMYAAHWLWGVAQALLLHNWLAGPALLATFWPLYHHRVPREEQQMLNEFGDEYRAYMQQTGRVVPKITPPLLHSPASRPKEANHVA